MEHRTRVRPGFVGSFVQEELGRLLSGAADLLPLRANHADHFRCQQGFCLMGRGNVDIAAFPVDHTEVALQGVHHSLLFRHPGKLSYQFRVVHIYPPLS